MHADLEIDITDPGSAYRQKSAEKKVHRQDRRIGKPLEHQPGPPVEDHRDQVRPDPLLFIAQHRGLDQLQPPEQENSDQGQGGIAKNDREQPHHFLFMLESRKSVRMNENDKGHHIGADEQRMKDNRKKMRYRSFDHNSFLSLATG